MLHIADWLEKLGFGQYAPRFAENDINFAILSDLTDQDLKELGVSSLGHRRQLLRAIAELNGVEKGAPKLAPATAAPVPPQPHDAAERRQLTVMFCDLVGSTALSARLDPEDMREIIGAYHRCCAELITKAGGFVAKYMGDGVLAYFGYPQAHEHDAERAVRAGLALVEAVPKLEDRRRRSVAGARRHRHRARRGRRPHRHRAQPQEQAWSARRRTWPPGCKALAEPGAVVISSSTRRLTGGLFDYRDLGTVALKGFAETVPAWQALGASAAESRFEALRASTTPLVGRGEEIDLLLRRWEQAKGGEGSVVLLSGEPGIGKSRIAETILERLSGEPHTRLR